MTKENIKTFSVSQKVILFDKSQEKFLLIKAAKPAEKKYKEFWKETFPWDVPGGRVEEGEGLGVAFLRDVQEEIGAVEFQSLGVVHTTEVDYAGEAVLVTFALAEWQEGEITLSDEHESFEWMTEKEILENADIKPWLKEAFQSAFRTLAQTKYLPDLLRLQADFENYKKRQTESQKELKGFLIQNLVSELTPVLDNFQQATSFVPEADKESPWVTGIQYIQKQLEDVLVNNGLTVITAQPGDTFDPSVHEAIEKEGEAGGTEITQVLQNGYKLGEKVIKPVRVKVK